MPDQTNTPEIELPPLDFGDYVNVEQKRYGVPNEMYLHKVITRLTSNAWADVPATPAGVVWHDHEAEVVAVICCGVSEDKVTRYRVADVVRVPRADRSRLQVDQDARDAKRYRSLRNHRGQEHDWFIVTDTATDETLWGADLDHRIDEFHASSTGESK